MAHYSQISPLSRPAFDLLHAWLKRAFPDCTQYANGKANFVANTGTVEVLLEDMANSTWPSDPKDYFEFPRSGKHRSLMTLNTTVRQWLAIASKANLFRYVALSSVVHHREESGQSAFRLYWGEERLRDTYVLWCKAPYHSEFIDLLVRGARIEAQGLGYRFHCLQIDTEHSIGTQIEQHIERAGSRKHERPRYVAILNLVDPATLAGEKLPCEWMSGGYPECIVSQDNVKIGTVLADVLWEIVKQYDQKTIVVLSPDPAGQFPGHNPSIGPAGKRIYSFETQLKRHGASNPRGDCTIHNLQVDFSGRVHDHRLCTDIPSKLRALSKNRTVGVFSPTGHPAALLLSAIHADKTLKDRIKVVAADITPTLVAMLAENEYPLEAICGVDPIEYGRMHVRVACKQVSRPNPISPRLITRDTITRYGIHLTSDILDYIAPL